MNYMATSRSNYFHVSDMDAYRRLFSGLSAEYLEEIHDSKDPEMVGFAADGATCWYRPASMCDDVTALYDAGGTLYDSEGDPVSRDTLNDYEALFDAQGDCFYDKWDQDDEFLEFVKELVKLIPDDEVFIYMDAGHEGWRYVSGYALVANKAGIKEGSLDDFVQKAVKDV